MTPFTGGWSPTVWQRVWKSRTPPGRKREPHCTWAAPRPDPVRKSYLPARNLAMFSFRNLASAGLLAAPAVWPHSEGMGISVHFGMNGAS